MTIIIIIIIIIIIYYYYYYWFNKLIYSIKIIIKCGIGQPVKFQLVSRFLSWIKTEKIFYRISELMLALLIQRYAENHFI